MAKSGCDAVYAERHTKHTSRTATRKQEPHIVRTATDTGGLKMAELEKCPFCGGKAQWRSCDGGGKYTTPDMWRVTTIRGLSMTHRLIQFTKCGARTK